MMRLRIFLPLVAVALISTASSAEATFQLRYSTTGVGGPFTTVTDGLAGDLDATPNSIKVSIGSVTIGATATNTIGVGLTLHDLAVSGTTTSGSTNLAVQSSIDGITTAPPPLTLTYAYSTSTLPAGATQSMRTWVDKSNVTFASGSLAVDTGSLSIPTTGSIGFNATAPYSMTNQVLMSGTGTFSLSLDNNDSITPSPAVPAPAGLMLAFAAMPILALGVWLRRKPRALVAA